MRFLHYRASPNPELQLTFVSPQRYRTRIKGHLFQARHNLCPVGNHRSPGARLLEALDQLLRLPEAEELGGEEGVGAQDLPKIQGISTQGNSRGLPSSSKGDV